MPDMRTEPRQPGSQMSFREIAQELGITPSAVKQLFHSGIRKLRGDYRTKRLLVAADKRGMRHG